MNIHIITIFPDLVRASLSTGIINKAIDGGLVAINVIDLRDHTHDRHRTVDDSPYGGGPGMVMRVEPFFEAVESLLLPEGSPVVLLSPQGPILTQKKVERMATLPTLTLLCGRYEGTDDRIRQHLATEELSIGDFILTGGELPAVVVLDSVVRLLPGALGHGNAAIADDTHTSGLIQFPQYTRPQSFRQLDVPEILKSGDHTKIARWRRFQSLRRTLERRPELLGLVDLSREDLTELNRLGWNGPTEPNK